MLFVPPATKLPINDVLATFKVAPLATDSVAVPVEPGAPVPDCVVVKVPVSVVVPPATLKVILPAAELPFFTVVPMARFPPMLSAVTDEVRVNRKAVLPEGVPAEIVIPPVRFIVPAPVSVALEAVATPVAKLMPPDKFKIAPLATVSVGAVLPDKPIVMDVILVVPESILGWLPEPVLIIATSAAALGCPVLGLQLALVFQSVEVPPTQVYEVARLSSALNIRAKKVMQISNPFFIYQNLNPKAMLNSC